MEKFKETFLKKYGIWEYVFAVLGFLILFRVGKWFWLTNFEDYSWEVIGFVVLAMALGLMLMGAPLAMLEWARKKTGLKTREEKLKE